jgi:hypothetical protein
LCTFNFLKISVASSRCWFSKILPESVWPFKIMYWLWLHVLLAVPRQQGQVQNQRDPVSVDQEKEGQESVYGSFRNDVGVETVAKIDWVDVVAVWY